MSSCGAVGADAFLWVLVLVGRVVWELYSGREHLILCSLWTIYWIHAFVKCV